MQLEESRRVPSPARIAVISGPNLDRIGTREPSIYGTTTLPELHRLLEQEANARGACVTCMQSNHEGALIEAVWKAHDEHANGIIINAGGYGHSSIALFDALRGAALPAVEVHLSHPEAREPFRHHSRIAAACIAKVAGFGAMSYVLALIGLLAHLARMEDRRP